MQRYAKGGQVQFFCEIFFMKFDFNPITGKLDLNGGGADTAVYYTSDEPTTEAHGGIPAGATFDHEPVCKVIDRILHKPLPPAVTVDGSPFRAGAYETGSNLANTLTATVTKGTGDIVKVELYAGQTLRAANTSSPNGGRVSFAETITGTETYRIVATDSNGLTAEAFIKFSFFRPVYYGLMADIPTSVSGLTRQVHAGGTWKCTYPKFDKKRLVFATPGSMSKALNPSLFDITKSFSKVAVSVKCLDGKTIPYTIYYSDLNSQLADYPVTYTFTTLS